MKRYLFYALPLLMLAAACSSKSDVAPVLLPQGTFSGHFAALIKKNSGTGYDTVRDSIVLKLTDSVKFAVLADTSVVHAGSKGTFAYNGSYIQFNDSTKVTTGPGSKFHLHDVYRYGYDGHNLVMVRNGAGNNDTLTVQYNLIKN